MKTKLTPEQSQRLIELGVDPSKASKQICTTAYGNGARGLVNAPSRPIFDLSDILSLLPKEISGYELNISATKYEYFVSYILWDSSTDDYGYIRDVLQGNQMSAPELIDVLFELLVWCITNKHLKL